MIPRRLATAAVVTAILVIGTGAPAAADDVRDDQWHLTDLDVAAAHQVSRGAGVIVAVIDTGVDAHHRDLAGAVLSGANTRHNAWDDPTGRDDVVGHGTHMAGIIAGRGHGTSGGAGVLGVAPAASILPISAPVNSITSMAFMTEAIDDAIARHAGVINMSFGGPDSPTMHAAIRKAAAADIVLVAASGNDGTPGEYPGRYPEVLTVGAYGADHRITAGSVTGPQVDIAAPGARIVTTSIGPTGYDLTTGTSDAAAIVSGAAALIRARYPHLSADDVVHRLTATADDAGPPGRDDMYGHGRINLIRALTADVAALPTTAATTTAAPDSPAPRQESTDLTRDLPQPANPLVPIAGVAVLVVLAATITLIVIVRRRNRGQ